MSSPQMRYQKAFQQRDFVTDEKQHQAVELLDKLYWQLQASRPFLKRRKEPVKGLYLWGDVGRGKTFLMDLFYESLPEKRKLRLHFHRFMARIHRDLNAESGNADPLKRIAKQLSNECDVLCFDEFFVSDIGDAMILGRLFKTLFEHGLTLVATSNIPIDRLYWDGLQRQRFEAAILLLQQYTQEIHLDGEEDHRLRHLQHQQTYFLLNDTCFDQLFDQFDDSNNRQTRPVIICGRPIEVIRSNAKAVWFSFESLCMGPRSALDYIELASRFNTILVSDIPVLGGKCRGWIKARGTEDGSFGATETGERKLSYARQDDAARRFISLVDELYDSRVNLYLSAEVPLEHLYSGGSLSFEFKRTYSRLIEMQSSEYLSSGHQ